MHGKNDVLTTGQARFVWISSVVWFKTCLRCVFKIKNFIIMILYKTVDMAMSCNQSWTLKDYALKLLTCVIFEAHIITIVIV